MQPHRRYVARCFNLFILAEHIQALRRALMGHHAGKMVVVLLQQRKYELQAIEVTPGSRACSGQALPQGWRNLLQPGSKLSINALVSRIDRDNSSEIVCPACLSSFTPDNADDHSDWLEWCAPFVDLTCFHTLIIA